jgi:hypothetical protein
VTYDGEQCSRASNADHQSGHPGNELQAMKQAGQRWQAINFVTSPVVKLSFVPHTKASARMPGGDMMEMTVAH